MGRGAQNTIYITKCHFHNFTTGEISPDPGVSSWHDGHTKSKPWTPGTEVLALNPGHTAGPGLSPWGWCLGPGRRMWQSPCHCSQHPRQGREDLCVEKAWLADGERWWQGRVGGRGTQLRGDGQCHLVPYHSQATGRLLTLLSSDDAANTNGTVPITSWPALWQP